MKAYFRAGIMNLMAGWCLFFAASWQERMTDDGSGPLYFTESLKEVFGNLINHWGTPIFTDALAGFVGMSLAAMLFGWLIRIAIRPVLRRVNTWLDGPVSK